jgi:hypothetical protein
MRKLLIIISIFIIFIDTAQSQSLKSISGNNYSKKTALNESFSLILKLNYYFHIADVNDIEHGYGFLGETQLMTTRYFGWLVTANVLALVKKDHDGINYTKFGGFVLTTGPKLYFNMSKLQGYTSIGLGAGIGGGSIALAVTPALGMEYKISNTVSINLETKSNIYLPAGYPSLSQFINAGIRIIL